MRHTISIVKVTKLESLFNGANKKKLYQSIVDAPFSDKISVTSIDLGIIVLLLVNNKNKSIDRIAISNTEQALSELKAYTKPFKEIRIPLKTKGNIISEAIYSGEYKSTENWYCMFNPELTAEQALQNQVSASIETSYVWPLNGKKKGALIFSFYQPNINIGKEHLHFMENYRNLVSKYI